MLYVRLLEPWLPVTCRRGLSSGARAVPSSVRLHRSLLLLGVSQHSEPQQVKEAYLRLAKVYHPDSGSPQASHQKFIQIREAYVVCMSHLESAALSEQLYRALEQEMQAMEQSLGYRRRRLAHRHYLEHDAAHGTPWQRQREHAQSRLNRAIDSVYDRQFQAALQQNSGVTEVEQSLSVADRRLKRAPRKSSAPLQRIADEKIVEEMNTGGFKSIGGKGAPLRNEPATHVLDNLDEKLNKVLINSGCAPDWIALDKEIRESVERLKGDIRVAWLRYSSCSPVERLAEAQWQEDRERFRERVANINDKTRKLNFDVPSLHMQRMPLKYEGLMDRVTREADTAPHVVQQSSRGRRPSGSERGSTLLHNATSSDHTLWDHQCWAGFPLSFKDS